MNSSSLSGRRGGESEQDPRASQGVTGSRRNSGEDFIAAQGRIAETGWAEMALLD